MPVRRFLVMFDSFPIDKASVKSGQNSPEVVTACRCVNVGLFVSGDLRRDVIVSIAVGAVEDLKLEGSVIPWKFAAASFTRREINLILHAKGD
jgi:tRNA pseudouridine-54 N-methylase